jgi:hypothetical protein
MKLLFARYYNMRWTVIPFERLRAIDHGCRGLARALAKCVLQGDEPDIQVLRVIPKTGKPHWYVEVRAGCARQRFEVNMSSLETQAAIVPIYLVNHVQRIREELSEVFENGFVDAIKSVSVFPQTQRGEKPS